MRLLFFLLLMAVSFAAKSQEGNWGAYMSDYEKGPGSVSLNLDLIKVAPKKELPFIVITGVTFAGCKPDGLPQPESLENLYKISDDVNRFITTITRNEHAGTFIYQCKRLDYIYVQDTVGMRNKMVLFYKSKYKLFRYHLAIKADKDWNAYRKFLYPAEETLEYMANEKVLYQLRSEGDKLDKPRPVAHWLYFETSSDRDLFITYALTERFTVEGKEYVADAERHYQLHLSRTDNVDTESIYQLTIRLKRKATEFKGIYDGWETVVVKE